MTKWVARSALALVILLAGAFLLFRVPDTDPEEMRAKYGQSPSRFVELEGGTRVHLRDEGPRDGLPIILLHGSNADLHTWQAWTDRLQSDFRIIRYDQVGHGLTGAAPDSDYSRAAMARDVGEVADALRLERFVLAGNSMGGGVALHYALAQPERLAGLVLVDAGGAPIKGDGGGNIGFTLARIPLVRDVLGEITPRSLVARSLEQSVSNKAVATPEAVDRYWELLRYPGNRDATMARFAQGYDVFEKEDIAEVAVPTLVMWGRDDALIPLAAGEWLAATLPEAELIAYEGIGHIPHEEAPELSADDLHEWLMSAVLNSQVPE